MTHKRPDWSECFTKGAIGIIQKRPNIKPFKLGISVQVGMEVTAEYHESTVCLRITKILENNDFEAIIKSFEPINIAPPKDLKEGETVLIDREHICCLFEKERITT